MIFTIFVLTVATGEYVTEWVLPKGLHGLPRRSRSIPRESLRLAVLNYAPAEKGFDPTSFQAEFEVLQSPDVLLPIINDLQLDKIWAQRLYKGSLDKMHPLDALTYMKSNVLKLDLKAWNQHRRNQRVE